MNTYFIKVALRDVSPMIWRRLRVQGNTSLSQLHHIIQIAMGWDNEHLHSFRIYGEDYGLSYEGGLNFNHNARQVFLDDFGCDAGDRFTYTYNFIDHWLCGIRIEHIEHSAKPTPWCYGGSGLQREDGTRYYKIDERLALFDILTNVITAKKSTNAGTLRPLIERYEDARFTRVLVNKQLVEAFHS